MGNEPGRSWGSLPFEVLELGGQTYKGLSTGLKLVNFHSVARVSICIQSKLKWLSPFQVKMEELGRAKWPICPPPPQQLAQNKKMPRSLFWCWSCSSEDSLHTQRPGFHSQTSQINGGLHQSKWSGLLETSFSRIRSPELDSPQASQSWLSTTCGQGEGGDFPAGSRDTWGAYIMGKPGRKLAFPRPVYSQEL